MEEGGAVREGDELGEGVGALRPSDQGCVADLTGLAERFGGGDGCAAEGGVERHWNWKW